MLTQANIARLIGNLSPSVRAETAASVAAEFSKGQLSDSERDIAVDILEILARDVEQQVRRALAEQVKCSPSLPLDLARTLAADIETVAFPVIRYSTVLTDDDLIDIVRGGGQGKCIAVAKRDHVAERVSAALVETGEGPVVSALLQNGGAQISETSLYDVLRRFNGDNAIHTALVERPTLPLTVIERLITAVSAELREHIIEDHGFPREFAEDLVRHGRERALSEVLHGDSTADDVERLVTALRARNVLTPTLVLRALCEGNIRFFDLGMAELARIPVKTARILIHDAGPLGLKGIYRKAGLPSDLFRAFRIAVDVMQEVNHQSSTVWGVDVVQRIIERIVAEYGQATPPELDDMLSQLWRRVTKHLTRVDIDMEPA